MKRAIRVAIGVTIGVAAVWVSGWVLVQVVGDHEVHYAGKPLDSWASQLTNQDSQVRTQAREIVETNIIPALLRQAWQDTNDSGVRLALIEQLNGVPGCQVNFTPAAGRRASAVRAIGQFGAAGRTATPALLQLLAGQDPSVCGEAASALVQVGADPTVLIPALIARLSGNDSAGRSAVIEALAEFGPEAKAASPMLVKLLDDHSSKDLMVAVRTALRKIDPEAADKAGLQ
jgi:HEAT repeat protein